MQMKIIEVDRWPSETGLRNNTKVLQANTILQYNLKIKHKDIEEVTSFPYLDSKGNRIGGIDIDIKSG